jgi:hypothetical protein
VIPVKVSWFELRSRCVTTVRHADRTADAKAALGEIEPIANGATNAVILAPPDEGGANAALHNEILDKVPNLVVDECSADSCPQAKAFA